MNNIDLLLNRVSLVLLDVDGTLLDSETSTAIGFSRAVQELGFEGGIADSRPYYQAWADLQREDFHRYLMGEQKFDEHRLHRTQSLLHLMTGEEQSSEVALSFLDTFQKETCLAWLPFDEVESCLAEMQDTFPHVKIVVASNGHQDIERQKLKALGLEDFPLFTSGRLGVSKPDPEFFRIVCAELEINPSYTLHVGDNYISDVACPVRAGLQAVWVNRHRRQQKLPKGTAKVSSLSELLTFE